MTERLATDGTRAAAIQSLASNVKEAMASTVKDAVSSAHSKAVAYEAKGAASSAVKGMQATLLSLRDGTKQNAGIKKVPGILGNQSHLEDATFAVDAAVVTAERAVIRETNKFADLEAALGQSTGVLSDDLMILNTVWHKVMSSGGTTTRSRKGSEAQL
ncbi:Hypothetical protein, putative [Bodo saltans]|uniref:Uncharacterized protein n=1 Tax=Bodo saltans TaxID=75058 RepID=A0A0S4JPA2_BODSA|nr:Hypothetical protein, putative [Bodo saltans]|eukprot:CUG90345.1 Hypothetical protein, putative [Bodo saltans]